MKKRWQLILCLMTAAIFSNAPLVKAENQTRLTRESGYIEKPEAQGWIKVTGKSPRIRMPISEEQSLEYGFQGFNEPAPPTVDANKSSFVPNVYLVDKDKYIGGLYDWDNIPGSSYPVNLVFGGANSTALGDKITGYTINNPRYYKKIDSNKNMTALMFKGDGLKDVYNTSRVSKLSQFDVTIIMSAANGAVKIDTFVKNNSNPALVEADWYKEVALYTMMDTKLADNDNVAVRFIGGNRGLYIEQAASNNVKGVYRLNYNFRLSNSVANWKAGKYGTMKSDQPVFNRNFGGFETYDAPGAEIVNGLSGEHAYDAFPANIPRLIDTAIFMKSAKQAFPIGSVMGYSYSVGLQKLDEKPVIMLDEEISITKKDDPNGFFISGQWVDLDSTQVNLAYQIDDGPIITLGSLTGKTGVNHDFRFDFTDKIKPNDQKVTFYATDNTNVEAKPVEQQVIYLDSAPIVQLENKNMLLNQSNTEYLVTGKVIDDKRKPDQIFYKPSKADASAYREVATVEDGNTTFSFKIPASEVPYSVDTAYLFDIRAVDKYGTVSEIESLKIAANHPKPTLTLEKNADLSLGQELKVKLFQDHEADFYPISIEYSVDDAPFKKLDPSVNLVADSVIQSMDSKEYEFTIPKEEISAERAHSISVRAVDRFDVLSSVQLINLEKVNIPVISTNFQLDKTTIVEGEKVNVTSTIKNTASSPSFWKDVKYETTMAFPTSIDVDSLSVKLNDRAVALSDITFSTDRKLQVKLGDVEPNIELKLTYSVISKVANPTLKEAFDVKQGYKVSGNSVIGGQVEKTIDEPKTFTVNRRTSKLTILHIEEGSTPENELDTEPFMEGFVGDKVTVSSKSIDGYLVNKVLIDGEELLNHSLEDIEIVYGETKEVKFYYKGLLRLKSLPAVMDFGQHEATFRKVRVNQPDLEGERLTVQDTRLTKKQWILKAVLKQEYTNIDDPNSKMLGILRYNLGSQKNEIIFELAKAEELIKHTNESKNEFVVSDTWSGNGPGFKLEVPNGSGKIGKYQARIEYLLEDTP